MSDADKILAEMLEAVPDTYQKTVGFPTWDWLAAGLHPHCSDRGGAGGGPGVSWTRPT